MNVIPNNTVPPTSKTPIATDRSGKKVYSTHPQFDERVHEWTIIRDAVNGERAIKAKGETYLPRPNPEDKSKEATARYLQYLARAVWFNATGRTLEGMVGYVFRKDSEVKLTPRLELIKSNIDGTGQTLEQLAKLMLARVLSYGRTGLLADYPKLPDGKMVVTIKDLDEGQIRPKIVSYSPFKIRNWRTTEIGARAVLSMICLEEEYAVDDDGFGSDTACQYRVLRLDTSNQASPIYSVEIWRKEDAGEVWSIIDGYPITPVDSTGKPLKEIPFVFVGWQENTPTPNSAPLYDMASVNVHHYMVSADYHEAVFLVGQPTPVFSGLTKDWVKDVFPKGTIALGTRAAIPLPSNATAMLLQAAPNTMAKEAMDALEAKMIALGSQLVQQTNIQKTATEERNNQTKTTGVLSSSAKNVSDALTMALKMAGLFIGEVDDSTDNSKISYQLNTDFDLADMTAQERQQLLAEWQGDGITTEEYRHIMVTAGIATMPFEEYKDALEADKALFPDPLPGTVVDPATGKPVPAATKAPAKQDPQKPEPQA
jgi:hypothetical protein